MWRAPLLLLRPIAAGRAAVRPAPAPFSGLAPSRDPTADVSSGDISNAEAKKLLRLVNVEALRRKLASEGREVIGYSELIRACEAMGVARSADEASAFAKALDDAGVVLLLRDKVYLHPNKVVEIIKKAVPSVIEAESDTRLEEWRKLKAQKEKIDMLAHKQVRRILWSGLGVFVVQMGLFFRLTFWEFSWDVMEPIAFFTTSTGLIVSYAYFLITSRDPSYQDFMKRLFLSRQKKLCEKENFDMNHYLKLQNHCHCSLLHDIGGPHELESIYKD